VIAAQLHAGQLLLALDGITTPEQATAFTGQPVRLPAAALRPLEAGEYFVYQLLGLVVEAERGERIGTVTDLIETGANDVLVVTPGDGTPDLLLPMIPAVILDVDPVGGRLIARRLEYYGDA
jgi:16S rRNA processing protein RimM